MCIDKKLKKTTTRSSHRRLFHNIAVKISQYSQETPVIESLFNNAASLRYKFIKKETPTHVFFCEYCEIFKNTYGEEHLQWLLLTNHKVKKWT